MAFVLNIDIPRFIHPKIGKLSVKMYIHMLQSRKEKEQKSCFSIHFESWKQDILYYSTIYMHFNFQITNIFFFLMFQIFYAVNTLISIPHTPFSNPYTPFSSGVKHHTPMKMHGISIGCIINKRITNLILLFICVISSVV